MDKNDLKKAMKDAQDLQLGIVAAEKKLSQQEISGSDKKQLIRVTLNGEGQYKSVKLSPESLKISHTELEKAILDALNDANQKAAKFTQMELQKITDALGLDQ